MTPEQKKAAIKAIKLMARTNGCTCDPDVTVTAGKMAAGHVASVSIAHDSWCKHALDSDEFIAAKNHAVRAAEDGKS